VASHGGGVRNRELRQGAAWWADLPDPTGRRPVLLLTRDAVLGRMTSVTVAPLTRTIRGVPTEVHLSRADGIPTDCVVSLDNILTIPTSTLDKPIARLNNAKIDQVFRAIRTAFQMPG
jgi:mRNA interferase MazF